MRNKSSIVGGLILILVGVFFLLFQVFPGLGAWIDLERHWPLLIVGLGLLFLIGAVSGVPALAIPGSIIGGIGSILFYQNMTGNWESWSYIWTFIPGFVGIGLLLMERLEGTRTDASKAGKILILISLIMFAAFGAFFSILGLAGQWWPIVLIILGGWILLRNRPSRRDGTKSNEANLAEKSPDELK